MSDWEQISFDILDAVPFAIMVTDAKANIIAVNTTFCSITGHTKCDVIGENPRILQSGRHSALFYEKMWLAIHTSGKWSGEIWNKRKDERIHPEWLTIQAVYNISGDISHYISTFEDISRRKEQNKKLQYGQTHDYLTQLPNRMLLMDRLAHGLKRVKRERKEVGLVYIDISDFDDVNDQYGHDIADVLLCDISQRLKACARKSDTVARISGSEFVVLVDHMHNVDDAYAEAQKILIALSAAFFFNGHKIHISTSIGIANTGGDIEAELLLKQADAAMYQAKLRGCNRIMLAKQEGMVEQELFI